MSFSRTAPQMLVGEALNSAMRSVGLRVGTASPTAEPADLELTLVSAAAAALPKDYRLLGVLAAWLEVHHPYVNVPRLKRFLRSDTRPVARAWWASVAKWLGRHDPRWRTIQKLYKGAALDLDDAEVTRMQLERVGPDPRFERSALRVHAKLLRSRPEDADDPVQLARRHPVYLKRVQLGANYRADVWAALDMHPEASVAEIARRAGCAYETARSVAEDWRTARKAAAAWFDRPAQRVTGAMPASSCSPGSMRLCCVAGGKVRSR